jgi:hypothetical protein
MDSVLWADEWEYILNIIQSNFTFKSNPILSLGHSTHQQPPRHSANSKCTTQHRAGNNQRMVRICQPFKEPMNRFLAWRNRFLGIDSWAPETFTIRTLY